MACRCNCATYREHLAGVTFAPSATGSTQATSGNSLTRKWNEDIPAMRRLAKAGITPPSSDGAANYERALDARS